MKFIAPDLPNSTIISNILLSHNLHHRLLPLTSAPCQRFDLIATALMKCAKKLLVNRGKTYYIRNKLGETPTNLIIIEH